MKVIIDKKHFVNIDNYNHTLYRRPLHVMGFLVVWKAFYKQ